MIDLINKALRHTTRHLGAIVLLPLLSVIFFGCGYHLSGAHSVFSSDTKTIAIPTFQNNTFEPVLESILTMHVKEEFLNNSRLRVINDTGKADLLLKGTIRSFSRTPVAFDRTRSVVVEYRVSIYLDIQLQDLKSKDILWKDSISTTAEYFVSTDTSATRVAQDRAVADAGKYLAEVLVSRVLEGPSY